LTYKNSLIYSLFRISLRAENNIMLVDFLISINNFRFLLVTLLK